MRVFGIILLVLGIFLLGFQGWTFAMQPRPCWVQSIWDLLLLDDRLWLLPLIGGGCLTSGLMLLARRMNWNGQGQ